MASIRRAVVDDLVKMQNCMCWCLPNSYDSKRIYEHFAYYPQLQYVAEMDGVIVGYVLGKMYYIMT